MSDLVDQIDAARAATQAKLKAAPQDAQIAALEAKLEAVKKKIVATKEGGAITGEERLREHTDHLYGALLSWEGKPARYLVERTDVLFRELADVKKEFEALGVAPQHAQATLPQGAGEMASACLHSDWSACASPAGELVTKE